MGTHRTLLRGAEVLDVVSGTTTAADVAIEGDHVVAVGGGLDGDEAVELDGATLVPGLIDCHAHMAFAGDLDEDPTRVAPNYRLLRAVPTLAATLRLGVTTVRDAWGADAGLRDAIDAGFVEGPRLQVSLAQICGTGGLGDHHGLAIGEMTAFLGSPWLPRGVFDGVDGAREAVRRMRRAGADVIKVGASGSATQGRLAQVQQVADDELREIVAEARRQQVRVMAHAHGARAIEAAARAGVDSIEHGAYLDEAALGAMLDHGTWLVPTLLATVGEARPDPPEWMAELAAAAEASFAMAVDAGVPIAMGTDCPVTPHRERLGELRLMHRLGMSAWDVWRSATSGAASLLGRDDLGVVEPGRRADLVAIDGPLDDFEGLEDRIRAVWKDGAEVAPVAVRDRSDGLA